MKTCKDCQKEVSKSAVSCPGCGKKLKKGKKLIMTLIIFALIIGGIVACVSSIGDELDNMFNNEDVILEEGYSGSGDEFGIGFYIEGHIRNDSDRDLSYVSVSFNAFDEAGNNIGTCLDNNNNLQAGQRWAFKALCLVEGGRVASYEFVEITSIN